jgi:hypothetical protein
MTDNKARHVNLARRLYEEIEAEHGASQAKAIWKKAAARRGRPRGTTTYHYDNIARFAHSMAPSLARSGYSDAQIMDLFASLISPSGPPLHGAFYRPPANREKRAAEPTAAALRKAIKRALALPPPRALPLELGSEPTPEAGVIGLDAWSADRK